MKKVTVCGTINYSYTAEVEDELVNSSNELVSACDEVDPVYYNVIDNYIMPLYRTKQVTDWGGDIVSIIDDETGKILYNYL